jgi:biotin carboxyl carrier protein
MLRSRNVGRLLQFLKKDGEYVSVGQVYAEIESMKMVINLEIQKAGGRIVQVNNFLLQFYLNKMTI